MKNADNSLLDYLITENLNPLVFKGNFGLEKENVRVDKTGKLALTPHPQEFGDKLHNPYITTDFSESQVEMVTPVCESIEEVYNFLENLQNIVSLTLEGEYLWPQSNPPILPEDAEIPIAVYASEGQGQRAYREKLAQKYGRKKQLLSGIHYNFSLDEDFINALYTKFGKNKAYKDFKDDIYLKITKNFLQYRWLLIYLTGASPVVHQTFGKRYMHLSEEIDAESHYYRNLCSIRNSMCGYKNAEEFIIAYDSLDAYINSIQSLIDAGKIDSVSEFYHPIRPKGSSKKGGLEQLKAEGIKYLELRIFDLNPFSKHGILLEDLHLVHLFLIYTLLQNDFEFGTQQQEIANMNHDLSTVAGNQKAAKIYNESGQLVSFRERAITIMDELDELVQVLQVNVDYLSKILQNAREKILEPEQTYALRLIKAAKDKSFIGFHLEKAEEYLTDSKNNGTRLVGYEDLELSTQILLSDAIRRGIAFDILDRGENFLRLSQGGQVEYVKQATMTSKDAYSTVLIMENKLVTKAVLKEHKFVVPAGETYQDLEDANQRYPKFSGRKIVIKPKSTNYGLGISILQENFSRAEFARAIEIAFSHDQTILIEEFVHGKEYRFLVIDEEVVGVLHRVPANVQGDGKRTIRELVTEKNQDPRRGVGHKTPLERIVLGEIEEMQLQAQGKDFDYLPSQGEVVFLRANSNISTGGDSIDYTDRVHESYKDLAVRAAKCIGAAITGVDIIIQDVAQPQDKTNYAIIELNFNPAMYMHCDPYQGKNRRVGDKVLNLLFGSVE